MKQRIPNAVQPPAWAGALPRPVYNDLPRVSTSSKWFEVYRLPFDVFAIYESGHFQEVISFLVLGNTSALLLDTGMGIGNMRRLVEELTDLPLTVVNSHCHFDHIGGNWQFDSVGIYEDPRAVARLRRGMDTSEVVHHLAGDSTRIPYPEGFEPGRYEIRPSIPAPLADGSAFDLGSRVLEIIHTPGHSPDSIMLLDRGNSILLSGDTFYPATLYAHLSSEDGINSDFATYRRTMRKLADTVQVDTIYPSHNEPMIGGEILSKVADAFDAIAGGDLEYEMDEGHLRKYSFDGFAIVTFNPPDKNA